MITTPAVGSAYPVSINVVLLVAHVYLGLMIFTHGYRKVFRGGRLAGTGRWLESIGVRPGLFNAYAAAMTELVVGVLLSLGLLTSFASAGLIGLMVVAIVTVHRKNGFMITNPGGGIEYCLGLSVMGLMLGTFGAGKYSVDDAAGLLKHWSPTTELVLTLSLGLGGALLVLVCCYRPQRLNPVEA